jgi:ubiquinone/menaquinone biosynthesis C-methylase UbiE
MTPLEDILDTTKAVQDTNGIWVTAINQAEKSNQDQAAWERIYNFDLPKLISDRQEFLKDKMTDHMSYIAGTYNFGPETRYLEIGCGPAYIAEEIMSRYDSWFIGVDFNYSILVALNEYLKQKGFTKYTLIYADITNMPIKSGTVDYIYGGGVVEHLKDTKQILNELYRVLAPNGVCFNTVPAFNLSWLSNFYYTMPYKNPLRKLFEYVHINVFKNRFLNKYFGYMLLYTQKDLYDLHLATGFKDIRTGPFAIHPSSRIGLTAKIKEVLYNLMKVKYLAPVQFVEGKK